MIPNIKAAQLVSNDTYTIACWNCKKPLWQLSEFEQYGTRWKSKKYSFPGVPDYEEYWESDQKTAKRLDCPHCGEHYLKAVQTNGQTFAIPFCPELEGL
jgi:Zn finger protein HypA/HybF involved in hydrogenase expression